jgi:hypothetical protein
LDGLVLLLRINPSPGLDLKQIKILVEDLHTVRSGAEASIENDDATAAFALWEGMLASENYCEDCLQESLSFLLSRIDELQ